MRVVQSYCSQSASTLLNFIFSYSVYNLKPARLMEKIPNIQWKFLYKFNSVKYYYDPDIGKNNSPSHPNESSISSSYSVPKSISIMRVGMPNASQVIWFDGIRNIIWTISPALIAPEGVYITFGRGSRSVLSKPPITWDNGQRFVPRT